jgi:hypothetical protein
VFVANIDSVWIEHGGAAVDAVAAAWDPETMDVCLMLASTWTGSLGFHDSGDVFLDDGVVRFKDPRRERAARLCRRPHLQAGDHRRWSRGSVLDLPDVEAAGGRPPASRRRPRRLLDACRRSRRQDWRPKRGSSRMSGPGPFFERPGPRWFSIPAHRPFVDDLARGLLNALEPLGPEALPRATVLTPTRRGARALADAFLAVGGGRALLLPQIRPLGDLDEGEPPFEPGELALDFPPAISSRRRRFELARLVVDHGDKLSFKPGPVQALELAKALSDFLDSCRSRRSRPTASWTAWPRATWPSTGRSRPVPESRAGRLARTP